MLFPVLYKDTDRRAHTNTEISRRSGTGYLESGSETWKTFYNSSGTLQSAPLSDSDEHTNTHTHTKLHTHPQKENYNKFTVEYIYKFTEKI